MINKSWILTIIVVWLGIFMGCSGGSGPVTPPDDNLPAGQIPPGYSAGDIILHDADVTIPPTTKVFTHDEDKYLYVISDFGSRYSFSDKSPMSMTVLPGDIIAGVKDDGFLRRVISVDKSEPGLITFATKPASLGEATDNASFQIVHKLIPGGLREVSSIHGPARAGADLDENFHIEFKDLVIYDGDENPYTIFDQATLSGFIDLAPVFEISVEIVGGEVIDFIFRVDSNLVSNLTAKAGGGVGFADERIKIATYYFEPIVFIADDLPVVITPKLTVNVGIATATGSTIIATVNMDYTYTSGLHYTAGELSPISSCETSNDCGPIQIEDSGNIQGYEGLLLDFYMYGEPGPKAHTEVTANLDCDMDLTPHWQVSTDMQAIVGGVVDVPTVFAIDLDWPDPVVEDHQDLCSGDIIDSGFKPPSAMALVEGDPPYHIETPITFDGTASHDNDESGDSIVSWEWDWDEGTGLDDPIDTGITTHTFDEPGIYYVQLKVTDNEGEIGLLDELLKVAVIDPTAPPIPGPPTSDIPITFNVTPDSENPSYIVANVSALLDGSNPLNGLTHDNFFLVEDGIRREDYTAIQISEGEYIATADIAFIIDVTGSMWSEIAGVRDSVKAFADYIEAENTDVRFAGIQFRDYLYAPFDFTDDVEEFKAWVNTLIASGGADTPENDLDAIVQAHDVLSWGKGSQHIMVVITDAPTHYLGDGTPFTHYTMDQVIELLQTSGYVLHAISPGYGVDVKQLADATGGLYTKMPSCGDFDLTDMPLGEVIAAGYLMAWLDPNPGMETSHEVRIGVFRTMAERETNIPWRDSTGFYPY